MSVAGRIPCLNPRCRRTADAAKCKPDTQIVCGKCWRSVPRRLRDEYRAIRKADRQTQRLIARRVARNDIAQDVIDRIADRSDRRHAENWSAISAYFLAPTAPVGIEGFLQEVGLA
jgi:hypothetical protein